MNRDEIRKEFLDKMQLHISTTNLRNGKTWWDEYIDFLEKKVSKLHQPTVSDLVCNNCGNDFFVTTIGGNRKCHRCGKASRKNLQHIWPVAGNCCEPPKK